MRRPNVSRYSIVIGMTVAVVVLLIIVVLAIRLVVLVVGFLELVIRPGAVK